MADAALLKGGVIVVVLLAALAVFDAYSNYSYAGNQATGAAVLRESGGGSGVAGVSIDLSNYPAFFIKNGIFDAVIVVGDQASSAHVLAAADIAYSLVSFGATSSTKLASEVSDTFAQNVISIGTGCANAITNNIQTKFGQISGGGGRCWNGALSGEGIGAITLYDFGNGKAGMVVEGYTDADVRRAAKVLVSYKDWQASGYLVGKAILVEATSQGGTQLHSYGWAAPTEQTACTDCDGGTGATWKCYDDSGGGLAHSASRCESYNSLREFAATECRGKECSTTKLLPFSEGRTITKCGVNGFVVSESCNIAKAQGGSVRDVLDESEPKNYAIGGKDYEVTLDFVGSTSIKLTINGETSRQLTAGDQWRLVDGSWITVVSTGYENFDGGTMQAEFILRTDQTASTSPTSNFLTLKADSFAVVALGAAFGSYYDAGKSTCKPDDFFLASWVYAPTTEYDEETGEQYESSYQNIMLFDVDADSKLAVKPNGHDYVLKSDLRKLKFSEKGLATFNWSEAAGAWILNEGPECTLALTYDSENMWENPQTVYAQPWVAKGINFVSVVPQMIGKTMRESQGLSPSSQPLRDVPDGCTDLTGELMGAYSNFGHSVPSASDALTKGDWDWWTPQHVFTQSELGLGMWLYSENTCKLDFR